MTKKQNPPPVTKQLTAADAIALQASLETSRQQAVIKRLEAEKRQLAMQTEELQKQFDALVELDGARRPLAPWEPRKGRVLSKDKRVAAAWALLSDVHIEEDVDPRTCNGLNRSNPAICSFRLQRHREGIEWLIREQQSMFAVQDLYLWLGGDLISGHIHEELLESNHLAPLEAAQFALREASDTIRYVRARFPEMTVHVICNYGNHGRTTQKPRISTGAQNSYEWMVYMLLRREFAGVDKVDVQVQRGEVSYTEVYGMTIRTTHGDATKYGGGVHGLSIPLGKAVMKWNQTRKAHLTIMGHYHTYFSGEELIVNGSVVGYNAYAIRIQAAYEAPKQAFFLIDRKRGKTQAAPLWVGDPSSESKIKETLPAWWREEHAEAAE
jgi:hypothetical protein